MTSVIRYVVFDLDNTLYPPASGVMQEVRRLILSYMTERLDLPLREAEELRLRYLTDYGTTMAGLLRHQIIDPDDYLSFVHDMPVDDYLRPNGELDQVLESIAAPKAIWTNATRAHSERVLAALGIRRHFDPIVDVVDTDYTGKPAQEVYERLLGLLGVEGPECVLVEDSVPNLRPAADLGMVTVLVDTRQQSGDRATEADFVIHRVEEIGIVVRGLMPAKHCHPDTGPTADFGRHWLHSRGDSDTAARDPHLRLGRHGVRLREACL